MHLLAAVISVVLLALLQTAIACSPSEDWRPPTPESAFHGANVVIHARVISQSFKKEGVEGKIEVIRVFKGAFSGDTVLTASSAACGIDKFNVGQEYVFFFPSKERWFVSHLVQPLNVTAPQTLAALRTLRKQK